MCVTRPLQWGNPFIVGKRDKPTGRIIDAAMAVRLYRGMVMQTAWPQLRQRMRDELGGKNLACFCQLDQPCHADVLLIIANTSEADLYHPDSDAWRQLFALGKERTA